MAGPRSKLVTGLGLVLWLGAVVAAPATEVEETPQEAKRPCSAPEYRQFDFWIGDWDVVSRAAPADRPPAHNRISGIEGGCVLREEYDTPGGYSGTSLSFYDAGRSRWHQTWIDNQGQPLYLSGGLVEGSMVLSDEAGGGRQNRITWTPQADGTVRQHWEATGDGGATWSTVFDGIYRPR